jgi:hypothetical protein
MMKEQDQQQQQGGIITKPFLRPSSSCSSILRLRSANSSDDDDEDNNMFGTSSANNSVTGSLSSKRTGVTLLSKEQLPSLILPTAVAATVQEEHSTNNNTLCVIQQQAHSRVFLCDLVSPEEPNKNAPPTPGGTENKEENNDAAADDVDDDDAADDTTQDTDVMSTGSNDDDDSIHGNDDDNINRRQQIQQEQNKASSASLSNKEGYEQQQDASSPEHELEVAPETSSTSPTTRPRAVTDDDDDDVSKNSCSSSHDSDDIQKLPAVVSLTILDDAAHHDRPSQPPPQTPSSPPCFAPYTLLYLQWTAAPDRMMGDHGDSSTDDDDDDPKTFVETKILSAVRQLQNQIPLVVARQQQQQQQQQQQYSDSSRHHHHASSIIKLALSKDDNTCSDTLEDQNANAAVATPCISSSPVRSFLSEDSMMLDTDYGNVSDDSLDNSNHNRRPSADQQQKTSNGAMVRPTNLYLVIDRVFCMQPSSRTLQQAEQEHDAALAPAVLACAGTSCLSWLGGGSSKKDKRQATCQASASAAEAAAWNRHVTQEHLAEQLARHVAAHPQLRFHCQGITVGVVTASSSSSCTTNHDHHNSTAAASHNQHILMTTCCDENAALPGLEACRQAIALGQRDRSLKDAADAIVNDEPSAAATAVVQEKAQPSRSHVGLVAPHPQALTQRLASAAAAAVVTATASVDPVRGDAPDSNNQSTTTASTTTTLLQTRICAEWNGQGNLTSFARRAHRLWRLDCGLPFERDPVIFRKVPKRLRRPLLYGYAVPPPPPPPPATVVAATAAEYKSFAFKTISTGTLTRLTPAHLRRHPHLLLSAGITVCTEAEETLSELAIFMLIGAYLAFHYYDFLLDGFTMFMSFFLSVCNPLEWDDLIQRLREL